MIAITGHQPDGTRAAIRSGVEEMHEIETPGSRWMAGQMSPEQADVFEVGIAILQLSRERARSRRDEPTQPLSASPAL